MVFEGTPAQLLRFELARLTSLQAVTRVRAIDPTWRPAPSLRGPNSGDIEREIAYHETVAAEANARLAEIQASGFGGNRPPGLPPPVLNRVLPDQRPFPIEIPLRPMGFPTEQSYIDFVSEGRRQLARAGNPDVLLVIRGSAATGVKHKTYRFFDSESDLDLAIVGRDLYERAIRFDRFIKIGRRTRAIGLEPGLVDKLGLRSFLTTANAKTGRKVSIVIYQDLTTLISRGEFLVME